MSRTNRPAALNRTVIGLTGLLLLAGGSLVIAAHYGRLRWLSAADPLVPGTAAPPTWVFWVAVVVAIGLALLCVRWLLAQPFRMPKSIAWQIGSREWPGATVLESATAAAPVATDIESYDGVRSASAWLAGSSTVPELHLVVTAETDSDVTALRRRILGDAVTRLRQALEVEIIPVTLELRFADAHRVR